MVLEPIIIFIFGFALVACILYAMQIEKKVKRLEYVTYSSHPLLLNFMKNSSDIDMAMREVLVQHGNTFGAIRTIINDLETEDGRLDHKAITKLKKMLQQSHDKADSKMDEVAERLSSLLKAATTEE